MSCTGYTPLTKTVILPAVGTPPPINGTVKIHIKQMLTNGTVLSDSLTNNPRGHEIDLTNTHVLSSLIDELMVMVPGEISQFRCAQEDMVSGLFSVDLPAGEDLVIEVEMLDWYGQDISEEQNKSLRKSIVEEGNSRGSPCWTGKCIISIQSEGGTAKEVLCRLGDGETYGVPYEVELCALTMTRNEVCLLEAPQTKYTLKLISFEKEKPLYKMAAEDVFASIQELKLRGNNAYKSEKLRLAKLYYERCISYIDSVAKSDQDVRYSELTVVCNLNLAQVYLKMEHYSKAVSHCTTVLWTQPKCVKALYRRAVGSNALCFHDDAIRDLTSILQLEPENREAKQLLQTVKSNKQSKSHKDANLMISVFKKIDEEHEKCGQNEPPPKSVWDDAEESCPPELASEEAYEVYKGALEEEEKKRKAEEAAQRAEYEAANPPKKKKKRKKKKKAATSEVTITETVEVPVDKPAVEVVPEPDEGMVYKVTAEKTIINQADEVDLANLVNSDRVIDNTETNGQQNGQADKVENGIATQNDQRDVVNKECVDGAVECKTETHDNGASAIDDTVADLSDIKLEQKEVNASG